MTVPHEGTTPWSFQISYISSSVVSHSAPEGSPLNETNAFNWLSKRLRLSINPAILNKNESGATRLYAEGWENVALTPHELAEAINAGFAYSCELKGSRQGKNFQASDLLSVDIDGKRRIEEVLEDPLVREHLTILYTTPSHTEEVHRFRLIFASPRTIEDPAEMRAATRSLALRLNGDCAVTDPARLFFGSRGSQPRVWCRGLSEAMLDELIRQGSDTEPVESNGLAGGTTASRLSLHPDQHVRTAAGLAVRVGDLTARTSVHCPFHHDTNPSAFVVTSTNGAGKGIHCSACAQTFWPAGTSSDYDFFGFNRVVEQARAEFERHRDWGPLRPFLGPQEHIVREGLERANIIIQDESYLRLERLEKGPTFIQSEKGTGKTEFLRGALATLKGSVLLISHRIALIQQTCRRLGLDCYLDFNGKLRNQRLGICWDSLHRLENHGGLTRYKTILIDESEQVLAHALADTMSGEVRDRNFKIFEELLKAEWVRGGKRLPGAERVVALDADLGFTTFATLTRLVNNGAWALRPAHVVINRYRRPGHIQVFDDRNQLIADLVKSLREGKRVFVTSNAKGRINALAEGIVSEFGGSIRLLRITSETNTSEEAVRFISNPSMEALNYDVILASPTIGTGVDITFKDNAALIDVVYGLFKDSITTHFDMDQQLGRVRHPGEVKVWISPRRFRFDTAIDVVRSDIHRQNLFKSVLLRYEDGKPVYDMDDRFIEMASLIVSRQRASKNNVKKHFIEHKEQQGYSIEIVEKDADLSREGAIIDRLGGKLSEQKRMDTLMAAEPLRYAAFQEIEARAKRNGEISQAERWSLARTKIERFYRTRISPKIITLDEEGRYRGRVRLFEEVLLALESSSWSELRRHLTERSAYLGMASRFRKSRKEAVDTVLHLLGLTPILKDGQFDLEATITTDDLNAFGKESLKLKPIMENLLEIEVRRDVDTKPMTQLNAILKMMGLRCVVTGKTRAQAMSKGRTIRYYSLYRDALHRMTTLSTVRKLQNPWQAIYEVHGWDLQDLEEARSEE